MKFKVTAQDILAQGEAVGAGRVCFYDGEFSFVDLDGDAIADALPHFVSGRYKLQAVVDHKWTNVSEFSPVFSHRRLLETLEKSDFSVIPDFDVLEVAEAYSLDSEKGAITLRKVFYNTLNQQARRHEAYRISNVVAFFSLLAEHLTGDSRYEYFLGYMEAFRDAQEQGLTEVIASPSAEAVRRVASGLVDDLAGDRWESAAARAGVSCVVGQVFSLTDRPSASKAFRALRESGHAELVEFFFWDLGALTYFGSDEVGDASVEIDAVVGSILPVNGGPAASSVAVGVSMDENFFRVYAPWLYFYAQQLPHVDFNFILCADREKSNSLASEGMQFSRSLAALNRGGDPSNVRVYSIPTPDFVHDVKTFYACARFFALPLLLEQYPQVYLMDADLYLVDDPTSFFSALQNVPFACPTVSGPAGLSPWRRYMAGNVGANRTSVDSNLMADLLCYIVRGLSQTASWMLDQNALAFAAERNQGSFTSLNSFKRPFTTSKFMRTWESNYRRRQASIN